MKSESVNKNRMKGDKLALYIIMIIIIAIAILVGASYGYELGIKKCNRYYSGFIRNNCYCHVSVNPYQTERFIPTTLLNLSLNYS